jgi:hypothetical protein
VAAEAGERPRTRDVGHNLQMSADDGVRFELERIGRRTALASAGHERVPLGIVCVLRRRAADDAPLVAALAAGRSARLGALRIARRHGSEREAAADTHGADSEKEREPRAAAGSARRELSERCELLRLGKCAARSEQDEQRHEPDRGDEESGEHGRDRHGVRAGAVITGFGRRTSSWPRSGCKAAVSAESTGGQGRGGGGRAPRGRRSFLRGAGPPEQRSRSPRMAGTPCGAARRAPPATADLETAPKTCQIPQPFQWVAPVAQGIEQRFPKPLVGRSIRLGGAGSKWLISAEKLNCDVHFRRRRPPMRRAGNGTLRTPLDQEDRFVGATAGQQERDLSYRRRWGEARGGRRGASRRGPSSARPRRVVRRERGPEPRRP